MLGHIARAGRSRPRGLVLVLPLLYFLGLLGVLPESTGIDRHAPIAIGIARSFFRDVPEPMVGAAMKPFAALMEAKTGLTCELASPMEADTLAEQLAKDRVQFGLFEGIQFAWAKQKFPELRPLVIIINGSPNRQAFLIVRHDNPATGFADLKGQKLAIPRRSRSHCHLFLERHCQECSRQPDQFFSRLDTSLNPEEALDGVVDGAMQKVVIDREALESYHRRKPGRFAKLRELQKSELFPDSVVAYHPGSIDETTLQRFREGLIHDDKNPLRRQLMILWAMTAFEPVPENFDQHLRNILKAYPPSP